MMIRLEIPLHPFLTLMLLAKAANSEWIESCKNKEEAPCLVLCCTVGRHSRIVLRKSWPSEEHVADTRIQLEVEDWVRRNWMASHFGTKFSRERLSLRSGGVFDFDAVSEDHLIVATISTSGSKTSTGKYAVGKMLKLRSDMLFLTMVATKRRLIILTERDMFDQCEKEVTGGRVPPEIEFACATIPDDLRARLATARLSASGESRGEMD